MDSLAAQLVVVDYHKGNLSSVVRGLARAGASAVISDDPAVIRRAAGIVLPGVGSFYDAMSYLAASGEADAIRDAVTGSCAVPFLGICLGQQLLFERGDEGVPAEAPAQTPADDRGSGLAPGAVFEAEGVRWVRGLGLLPGSCTRLPAGRLKVPHVGWDQIHLTPTGAASPLLADVAEGANVYFTHSYALGDDAEPALVAARTFYARAIPAVIARGNLFGCQFHPEKSSAHGQQILKNFVAICARARSASTHGEGAAPDVAHRAAPASQEVSA